MNENKIAEINTLVRKNSKNELMRLCKEKNLNYSGTKHDMAVRLIGGLKPETNTLQKEKHVKKIIVRKNKMDLWEFEGLIFDDKTKNVIGCLDQDGTIQPLQRKDVEKCKQYKFLYTLPEILDERLNVSKNIMEQISSSDEEEQEDDNEDEENNF